MGTSRLFPMRVKKVKKKLSLTRNLNLISWKIYLLKNLPTMVISKFQKLSLMDVQIPLMLKGATEGNGKKRKLLRVSLLHFSFLISLIR